MYVHILVCIFESVPARKWCLLMSDADLFFFACLSVLFPPSLLKVGWVVGWICLFICVALLPPPPPLFNWGVGGGGGGRICFYFHVDVEKLPIT